MDNEYSFWGKVFLSDKDTQFNIYLSVAALICPSFPVVILFKRHLLNEYDSLILILGCISINLIAIVISTLSMRILKEHCDSSSLKSKKLFKREIEFSLKSVPKNNQDKEKFISMINEELDKDEEIVRKNKEYNSYKIYFEIALGLNIAVTIIFLIIKLMNFNELNFNELAIICIFLYVFFSIICVEIELIKSKKYSHNKVANDNINQHTPPGM